MNIQKFVWIILPVLLLGCSTNAQKDHDVAGGVAEKKKGFVEKVKAPEGLKLSSILYELAVAADPEIFAKQHDISLYKGQARVFIFFDPASSGSDREKIVEKYQLIVEKKSNDLLRTLVPINKLIPLSRESVIGSITLPNKHIP
jgi:hypothetical protein